MAERRMFAKSVIGSARFLRMPATSRLLYYDLGMEADDDGCVEAFSVMRRTGATEDDLRVLASKGFVRVLNDDLVSYIMDWNTNNKIRKDRYHQGVYKGLIEGFCNVALAYDNQLTTTCQPSDCEMAPEVRLGKDRLVEGRLIESIGDGSDHVETTPKRKRFIPPTLDEVKAYCQERGNNVDPERFMAYYESNGWMVGRNKMKDWKAAVRSWERSCKSTRSASSNPFLDMMGG